MFDFLTGLFVREILVNSAIFFYTVHLRVKKLFCSKICLHVVSDSPMFCQDILGGDKCPMT